MESYIFTGSLGVFFSGLIILFIAWKVKSIRYVGICMAVLGGLASLFFTTVKILGPF